MSQIRVNIKHRVANSAIRRETRNGREVIVVPSAVARFDTVLNGIMYPEAELRASYEQINNLPAPLGHPVVNSQYVSARDPEAINQFWVGAWNTAARIDGDRILAEKVVDVETAQATERGQALIKAINDGDPISTSTGLMMERDPAPEGAGYDWIGRNFVFDHDAILLNETPAIGTAEGVGMMVNSAGERVEVVNSELVLNEELPGSIEDMRKALQQAAEEKYGNGFIDDFNADSIIFFQMEGDKTYKIGYGVMDGEIKLSDQRQEVQRKTTWEAVTNTIRNTLSKMFGTMPSSHNEADGLTTNSQTSNGEPHMTKEEIQAALAEQADALKTNQADAIAEAIKPLQDKIDALESEKQAAADAEHATAVEAVVNAKLMGEDEAKALPTAALNALANAAPKTAAPLAPGFAANADDARFDTLPE